MIFKKIFPDTVYDLLQIVSDYTKDCKSAAVQAGHFLVYYDHTENMLLPCVKDELKGPRFNYIGESVGQFPLLTWEIGIELISNLPLNRKSLLTVVNDWQYLPHEIDRMSFYKSYDKYFDSYNKLTPTSSEISFLSQSDLGMKTKTGVWFSEVSLRNQFNRTINKKIKREELDDKYIIEMNNNNLSCSLVDAVGKKQQIYCAGKRGNCTHELAELNRQVLAVGKYNVFINLYPLVCKNYIQTGTDWAYELFLDNQITINIGMPSSFVKSKSDLLKNCEVTIHGN